MYAAPKAIDITTFRQVQANRQPRTTSNTVTLCGPPLSGGRLSQSQPEWMDPSPQVLGITG